MPRILAERTPSGEGVRDLRMRSASSSGSLRAAARRTSPGPMWNHHVSTPERDFQRILRLFSSLIAFSSMCTQQERVFLRPAIRTRLATLGIGASCFFGADVRLTDLRAPVPYRAWGISVKIVSPWVFLWPAGAAKPLPTSAGRTRIPGYSRTRHRQLGELPIIPGVPGADVAAAGLYLSSTSSTTLLCEE